MPGQFTFIGNEWDSIITQPDILLPGIEKISVIYWSAAGQELKALTSDRQGNIIDDHAEILRNAEGKYLLQKYRSTGKPYSWIKIEESPLIPDAGRNGAFDLFSELQNTILILRYRNEADGKYDVLVVYLNKNLNPFGISVSDKILSTENKSVIASILYQYFKKIYSDTQHNHSILRSVRLGMESMSGEIRKLKAELGQVTLNLEEMIVNLAQQLLQEFAEQHDREYSFSEEALEKLRSYRGNIRHLPAIIEQSVVFSGNMLITDSDDTIRLEAGSLSFEPYQAEKEETTLLKRIDSRESRTIQLLDKLERSAMILKSKDIPMTSVNIGRNLAQPISAPAITDALRKHKPSILQLMRKYPGKWELIREEFRPIQNLFKQDRDEKVQGETA